MSALRLIGTLQTAAQPKITSIGDLSSPNVSGNAVAGNVSAVAYTGTSLSLTGDATVGNVTERDELEVCQIRAWSGKNNRWTQCLGTHTTSVHSPYHLRSIDVLRPKFGRGQGVKLVLKVGQRVSWVFPVAPCILLLAPRFTSEEKLSN